VNQRNVAKKVTGTGCRKQENAIYRLDVHVQQFEFLLDKPPVSFDFAQSAAKVNHWLRE
jgi:hypothetical protein